MYLARLNDLKIRNEANAYIRFPNAEPKHRQVGRQGKVFFSLARTPHFSKEGREEEKKDANVSCGEGLLLVLRKKAIYSSIGMFGMFGDYIPTCTTRVTR